MCFAKPSFLGQPDSTKDEDYCEYPFVTPDGTPLFYSLPGEKFKRVRNSKRLIHFKPYKTRFRNEWCLPKLWGKCNKHQRQFLIFIDIEQPLDRAQRTWLDSVAGRRGAHPGCYHSVVRAGWEILGETLQDRLGDIAYVFFSRNHKPKIALIIEYSVAVKVPKLKEAKALIERLLPEYVQAGAIDLSENGIFTAFIKPSMRVGLMEALRHLTPIPVRDWTKGVTISSTESPEELNVESVASAAAQPRTTYCYDIPSLPEDFEPFKFKGRFKQFIQILTGMTSLKSGFDISQNIIANTLGIKQATACYYVKKVVEMGWLKVKNDTFMPGKKAKTYVATGPLLAFLTADRPQKSNYRPPSRIEDGNWHQTLLEARTKAFKYKSQQFLKWVRSLPGHQEKDRLYQAERIDQWASSTEGESTAPTNSESVS